MFFCFFTFHIRNWDTNEIKKPTNDINLKFKENQFKFCIKNGTSFRFFKKQFSNENLNLNLPKKIFEMFVFFLFPALNEL